MTNPLCDSLFQDSEFVDHLRSLMAQQALRETGANGVAIALKEDDEFVCRATAGEMAPSVGVRLQKDSGITAACIRSGQTVVCHDATSDARVNAAACKELGIASIIVIPIKNRKNVVGFIEALSEKLDAFGASEQVTLERIAHEIDEIWTPGQIALVHDDEPNAPALTLPTGPIEDDGAHELFAEQGSARHRSSLAAVIAPLAVMCVLGAALLLIFGRVGSRGAIAGREISAELSMLPLSRGPLLDLSPGAPTPAAKHSPRSSSTVQPSVPSSSGNSIGELEASAEAGDASAQVRLATALADGDGAAADPVSADAWYIVADLAGNTEAAAGMRSLHLSNSQIAAVRQQLATMYWKGIGVKRDLTTAYFWLTVAEAAGAEGASESKQRLATEMKRSQIAQANLRAQQWLVQHHQLVAQDWSH